MGKVVPRGFVDQCGCVPDENCAGDAGTEMPMTCKRSLPMIHYAVSSLTECLRHRSNRRAKEALMNAEK
jgi:hypothetical protein